MCTDYTLPSDATVTADAYDRRLDTDFAREGNYLTCSIKRKNEKADLET